MFFPSYFSTLPVLYAIVDAAAIVPQVENSAKDTVIIVKEREVFNIPAQVALTQGALKGGNAEVSVTSQCTGKEQLTANSLLCTDEKCKGEEKIRKCTAAANKDCPCAPLAKKKPLINKLDITFMKDQQKILDSIFQSKDVVIEL